ncbi:hypothetical protein L6164_010651 [Bauhinia variegata]|uniref:Uncharacterized protein n=1 Tax=Bauhinia variegata TaxID=167791 RepID=A0ACB9PN27_BAUVA|nr:hypothetical protein L6164_010651 [Bauhinia variegata]
MNCFPCFSSLRSKKNLSKREHDDAPQENERPKTEEEVNNKAKGDDQPQEEQPTEIQAQNFTFRELASATKNFRQECLLGEVYEFISGGSLEDRLFGSGDKAPLDWFTRMKIASGGATGLQYLHEDANPPVIYRDMKSSNILLDDDLNPKLNDFGLAKLAGGDTMNPATQRVMGTYGYSAPEYERSNNLTLKSDVYSFGVVLLELITGRRAIDTTRPNHEQNLVQWAQPMFRDPKKFPDMADPLLNKHFPEKDLNQAVAIAAMCLQEEAAARPLIGDVVTALSFLSMVPPEVIPASLPPPSPSQESVTSDEEDSHGQETKNFYSKSSRKRSKRSRNGSNSSSQRSSSASSEDGSVSSSHRSSRKSKSVKGDLTQKSSRKASVKAKSRKDDEIVKSKGSKSSKNGRKCSVRALSHKSSMDSSEGESLTFEQCKSRASRGNISSGSDESEEDGHASYERGDSRVSFGSASVQSDNSNCCEGSEGE